MTDLPDDLTALRGHQIRRLEFAPYRVPLDLEDGEFHVDGAGVDLIDGDWIDLDDVGEADPEWVENADPLWCSCEATFADEAAAREHIETIGDVEEAVLERLMDQYGRAYAYLAKKDAQRYDQKGPLELVREGSGDIREKRAAAIASLYAGKVEQTDADRLDAVRAALDRRDGLDQIEQRGGVIPTEQDR